MKSFGKINTAQIFSVLFLCRIISLFTFMLPSTSYLPSGDRILTVLPVAFFEILYSAVAVYTLKKNRNKGLIDAAQRISPALGKIIAVLFTLCFIWFAGIGTARFELFISTVMFPNSKLLVMIIFLLLASLFAASKGIEAIGRASFILLWILGLSIVFILLSVTGDFRITNLQPILTEGISPLISFSFYVSVRAAEILTLHIAAPFINGSIRKLVISWVISFAAVSAVILTVLSGVTGEYGNDQIFPLYTLTVIAKFGIFERLDDILTGVWVLCCFIQVSYLLCLSVTALKQGFGKTEKIPLASLCAAGIFTVYFFTSKTVTVFSETVSSRIWDIVFIAVMIAVPLIITAVNNLKERRKI